MVTLTAEERAERLSKLKAEGKVAMAEYRAEQEAVRARTERLRAVRLAREEQVKKNKIADG